MASIRTVGNPLRPVTQGLIKSMLSYDIETGEFRWRSRPIRHGKERTDKSWNARYTGMVAGTIDTHGYRKIGIDRCLYYAHRLAWLYMTGDWPEEEIDHINRNRADNRWNNLRTASRQQNVWNQGVSAANTTGFKGVSYNKQHSRWEAYILSGKSRRRLGLFQTPEEAHAAYAQASTQIFGEFAGPNRIDVRITDITAVAEVLANNPDPEFVEVCRKIAERHLLAGLNINGARLLEEYAR